jgi:SAM-dependent methyltransferase
MARGFAYNGRAVPEPANLRDVAEWMRRDWNRRAIEDADRFVYTRDSAADEQDFIASGRANYNQLVRPYLPLLLQGADPRACCALEIGCGTGRMTRWFAEAFGEVHGIDVAPEMIARARERLAAFPGASVHIGSGFDLRPFPDSWFHLVFSYIVFQHIPSVEVIGSYVKEAARVLRPGGAFKFQVNGNQSPAYRVHVRDTWQGETFSLEEISAIVRDAGLSVESVEDPSTQYFVITARKGDGPDLRSRYLPGEPEDAGWRPARARSTVRLHAPSPRRLYAGIYFWPADPDAAHSVAMTVNGTPLGSRAAHGPGDHFLEWDLPRGFAGDLEVVMEIEPTCSEAHRPALRIVGVV